MTYEEILADIRKRDARDGGRADAPMTQAADAVLLDTTEMTIEQAADAARRIVEAARARGFREDARPGKSNRAFPSTAAGKSTARSLPRHRLQPSTRRRDSAEPSSLAALSEWRHLKTKRSTWLTIMSLNPSRDDFAALLDESLGGRDFMEGHVVQGHGRRRSRRTSPSSTSV